MKLTDIQKQNVINYLINQGLEYKEFIDEMYDHFIDSIEAKMDAGTSFFFALEATGEEFKGEIYKSYPFRLFPKKGLKALERRYYKSKKREMNAELKGSMKSSILSVTSLLIVCYAAFAVYFLKDSPLKDTFMIFAWAMPSFMIFLHVKKSVNANFDNAGGLGWLLASKKQRVRSVEINLLLHISGNRRLAWLMITYLGIYYAARYDYVPETVYSYFMVLFIATILFFQTQAVRMIPKVNKLIEA